MRIAEFDELLKANGVVAGLNGIVISDRSPRIAIDHDGDSVLLEIETPVWSDAEQTIAAFDKGRGEFITETKLLELV